MEHIRRLRQLPTSSRHICIFFALSKLGPLCAFIE